MNGEMVTLALLVGAAIALTLAWYMLNNGPRTPIPDVYREAFDGH